MSYKECSLQLARIKYEYLKLGKLRNLPICQPESLLTDLIYRIDQISIQLSFCLSVNQIIVSGLD